MLEFEHRIETLEAELKQAVNTIKTMAGAIDQLQDFAQELGELFCLMYDEKFPNNSAKITETIETKKSKINTYKSRFELIKKNN